MYTPEEDSMYRLLVQSVTDYAIYLLTTDGTVSNWNAGAERAKGYSAEEIVGKNFSVFYTDEDRARGLPQQMLDKALREDRAESEGWRIRKNGTRLWVHATLQPVRDVEGVIIGFAKITRDLTAQRERERKANEQERNFRMLVQGVVDYAIFMLSPEGYVTNWNAGAERAKGYRAEEIVGQHFSRFYRRQDRRRGLPDRALSTALKDGRFEGEGWRLRKDGSRFWAQVVIDRIRDDDGKLIGFAKITRDITEKKMTEEQIKRRMECRMLHMAHHDALTSMLNRASFRDIVHQVLNSGRHCALLCLDLDRFKPINDTLGHCVGDRVLQVVAERILGQLRKTDAGGRLGGDEFAILLVGRDHEVEAKSLSERLIREIERPITVDGITVFVGASVGIASTTDNALEPEMLLRNADLAVYAAKNNGRGTCRRYEPGMEANIVQRKSLENDLRLALLRNEFSLHYQPLIEANGGSLTGYEALIRWESPTRGMVSPANFIPFAEKYGLMVDIGEWVLQTACAEASRWPNNLRVSVNMSPAQFRSPNLVTRTRAVLASVGLAPERLEVEITEIAMMGDVESAKAILEEMRAEGILVALDDFGTGYSALSLLQTLPFTRVKIDRSFVQNLGRAKESLEIVRAVIALCRSLGLSTTAEGVETEEQLRVLQREGCHELQGYLLGPPAPMPERQLQSEWLDCKPAAANELMMCVTDHI